MSTLCSQTEFCSSGCLWRLGGPFLHLLAALGRDANRPATAYEQERWHRNRWVPLPRWVFSAVHFGFPFLGNEARAVRGASVSPGPGPGSDSSFKLTCIFWLFFCICFFSARDHFEFHLPLKEKQSSFNAAVITCYFFSISYFFSLILKTSLHLCFSFNSLLHPLPV